MNETSKAVILEALSRQEKDAQLLLAHAQELRELVLSGADMAVLRARLTEAEEALGADWSGLDRDPELFQAMVRIDKLTEPLRSATIAAVQSLLNILDTTDADVAE